MELDDELCLCFHVTKRKVVNYLRVEKPDRASQLGDCFGAGTGCGWCRPFLEGLFEAAGGTPSGAAGGSPPDAAAYARLRDDYIRRGQAARPGGSTAVEPDA